MRNVILTLTICANVFFFGAGRAEPSKVRATGQQKLANVEPATIQLKLNAASYAYRPVNQKEILIDQPSPTIDFEMTLQREDQRFGFGDTIPGWRGSKEVVLKDGYRLRIKARYLKGEPRGDEKGDKHGLSLDVSYLYDNQLLGFQTETKWAKPGSASKVTVELKDIPYFGLLHSNDFALPAVTDGYGEGFRAWAAVRDGLKKRDRKEAHFNSITEFLKPLSRKDDLMIPTVTVVAQVK